MVLTHVITNFEGVGGAETMLVRLIKATPEVKHKVISLIGISQFYIDELQANEVELKELNIKGPLSLLFIAPYKLICELSRDDVVMSWMYHACVVAGFVKLIKPYYKVFFNVRHSLDTFDKESLSTRLAIYVSRFLSRKVDSTIYCSKTAMKQHLDFGFYRNKAVYIPNGYDFSGNENSLPVNGIEFVIGSLGRFHKAKDYPNLLKAFSLLRKKYKNVRLRIGGKGISIANEDFALLLKRNELNQFSVDALGPIENVQEFYGGIDLFVLSSITEGFPNVLVEAMARKLPVVSTNVGDALNILKNDSFICPSSDPQKLSELMEEIYLMSPEKRQLLGSQNQTNVMTNYQISQISKIYMSLFNDKDTM